MWTSIATRISTGVIEIAAIVPVTGQGIALATERGIGQAIAQGIAPVAGSGGGKPIRIDSKVPARRQRKRAKREVFKTHPRTLLLN